MITDIKLHRKIASEHTHNIDIVPNTKNHSVCWEDPTIVIKTDNGYIASHVQYHSYRTNVCSGQDVSFYKKTFDFCLVTPFYTLRKKDICKVALFIPNPERPGEYKSVYTCNAIILLEEIKNAIFVFYKDRRLMDTFNFINLDAEIYISGSLKYSIKDIYNELEIQGPFNPNAIHFKRTGKVNEKGYPCNWLLLNGKEISEDDLDLSFIEWERLFGYHRNSYYQLSHMYDIDNIHTCDDERLRWNSKELVGWKCIFGHKWKESVYNYTHPKWPRQFCPVCQSKLIGLGYFDVDAVIKPKIEMIMSAMKYYGVTNLNTLLERVNADYEVLGKQIVNNTNDTPWISESLLPDTITFFFLYPDGRHGDISRVIAEQGNLQEIGLDEYKCTISTKYYREIEVLSSYYCNAVFSLSGNNSVSSFMFENHLLYKYSVLNEIRYFYRCQIVREQSAYIDAYKKSIKDCSDRLYALAVEKKLSTGKWTSEQKLYRIVKKKYPSAIYQYHDEWLGLQSIDIYIPGINVGIEYQGKQHYIPVELFGGIDHFEEGQERDKKKRNLCKEHGVKLIEWRYDNPICEEKVYEMISKTISG